MAVNINLFPPVVDTYLPAFLVNSGDIQKNICRVYFSISSYNTLNEIKNIQVTVSNQNTNISVLNKDKYPCEVMLSTIKVDRARESDDKYFVEIYPSDIEDGFQINQYYKVQLRFTGIEAEEVSLELPQKIDSWLTANLSNFSEWSTVCLIRGISTPKVTVSGFDQIANLTLWSLNNVDVIGHISFEDSTETDTLKNYRIKLYKSDNNELLSDSGLMYTGAYANFNEFNYTFEYAFEEDVEYYFTFEYETMALYKEEYTYSFLVIQESVDKLDATLTATLNEIDGCIELSLKNKDSQATFVGNITIRRSSSETNFTIWEDIHTISFEENSKLSYTWRDYTIKSGVYYKYIAQKRNSIGTRGVAIHAEEEPFMMLFDDMYITGGDAQLAIRFDPSITSFKRTVSESRTDTIGNKYPFVKRNGEICYRQFPIGGTITTFMDSSHLLTSEEELFKDSLEKYKEFNDNEDIRINQFNDWTYEREFREKVMDFLYDNKVRLFRSATEGNILIKLTDINFTPNATLGRRIYSFSATAIEVDECSVKNYDKYGIAPLGKYDTQLQFSNDFLGQFNEKIPANTDILSLLLKKYEKYTKEGYVIDVQNLDYLRLEIEDKPYLIKEEAEGPYVMIDAGPNQDESPATAYLGYLTYINNNPIVINPEGIYELKGANVEITSLMFPVDTTINISYHVNLKQTEDLTQIIQSSNFYKKVGQLWGGFKPNVSVYQQIWKKYFEKYSDYSQTMLSLDRVRVEADPGTVVYIKESLDSDFERHVIGNTCSLEFYSKNATINGLYFAGVHFEEANETEKQMDTLPDFKFIDTGITLDNEFYDTSTLVKNGVYRLAGPCLEIMSLEKEGDNYYPTIKSEFLKKYGNTVWNGGFNIDGDINMDIAEEVDLRDGQDLIPSGETIKDEYYNLILNKDVDKQYTLILQQLLDKADNRYIWYNDQWWLLNKNNDIISPVEAVVDYYCEVMKGRFAV